MSQKQLHSLAKKSTEQGSKSYATNGFGGQSTFGNQKTIIRCVSYDPKKADEIFDNCVTFRIQVECLNFFYFACFVFLVMCMCERKLQLKPKK